MWKRSRAQAKFGNMAPRASATGEPYFQLVAATPKGVLVTTLLRCGSISLSDFSDESGHHKPAANATRWLSGDDAALR